MSGDILFVFQFIFILNQIACELETPIDLNGLSVSNVNFAYIKKKINFRPTHSLNSHLFANILLKHLVLCIPMDEIGVKVNTTFTTTKIRTNLPSPVTKTTPSQLH